MNKKSFILFSIFALGFGSTRCASEELDAPSEQAEEESQAATIPQAVIDHAFRYSRDDNAPGLRAILQKYPNIVNAVARDGKTLLHIAVLYSRTDIIKLLIEAGADVNAVARDGIAPLHMVCIVDAAEALIEAGADVNAVTRCGQTPLHFAVKSSRFDVVKTLSGYGANVDVANKSGSTALDICIDPCYENTQITQAIAAILIGRFAAVNPTQEAWLNVHMPNWKNDREETARIIWQWLDSEDIPTAVFLSIIVPMIGGGLKQAATE